MQSIPKPVENPDKSLFASANSIRKKVKVKVKSKKTDKSQLDSNYGKNLRLLDDTNPDLDKTSNMDISNNDMTPNGDFS